jgi:hypothetical protein
MLRTHLIRVSDSSSRCDSAIRQYRCVSILEMGYIGWLKPAIRD